MIVYGTSISPFVRKVLFLMGEKGIKTEHLPILPNSTDEAFRACSPFGKLPGFSDGDFKIADSSAICHYLEKKFPETPLLPSNPEDLARVIWFEEFHDTVMFPTMVKIFFNLFLKPRLFQQEPDLAAAQVGIDELPALYDYLESQINGPFLVGNKISLADISLACPFVNLAMVKQVPDPAKWPKLVGYIAGLQSRPAFMAISDPKA
jgi:glutathione S-transferase